MPRSRRRLRERAGALTSDQEWELLNGPNLRDGSSEFADDEMREEAWFANRESLLEQVNTGTRPWGWWRYESGLEEGRWPSGHEAEWLHKQGLLTPFEEQQLAEKSDGLIACQARSSFPEKPAPGIKAGQKLRKGLVRRCVCRCRHRIGTYRREEVRPAPILQC